MAFVGAVAFAKIMHGDQKRKSFDAAFITHPLAVASLVMEYGNYEPDDDVVQAALLHDIIEDTSIKLIALEHEFSPHVAKMVSELSHAENTTGKPKRLAYVAVMENTDEPGVLIISACDKLDNMRSILHAIRMGEGAAYRHGLWFYHDLYRVYRERGVPGPLLVEYQDTLQRVEAAFAPESSI